MFGSSSSLSAVPIEIEDLGRAAYAPTLEHMRALHARVANGEDAGRILIVEHDPVYTAGRATPAHELVPQAVPIERGGKITYHGPGQLVVYPEVVPLPAARGALQPSEDQGGRQDSHDLHR